MGTQFNPYKNKTNYIVVDFEVDTAHGDYGHPVHSDNRLLLACWKRGDESEVHACWGGELEQSELVEAVKAASFVVAHNAKYELGWLLRAGLDIRDLVVFDTKLAEYVLMGNLAAGDSSMPPRSTSLDACCRRRGLEGKDPAVNIMMNAGINPVEQPRSWVLGRCRRDVLETEELFKSQRAQLENTGRMGVFYTRCALSPVLARMEFAGMKLDCQRVLAAYTAYSERLAQLEVELEQITQGVNWRSGPQMAELLYKKLKFKELRDHRGKVKRTSTGRPLTDQNTLNELRAETEEQTRFLTLKKEIGKTAAALSKNLEFFQGACEDHGGMIYAVFNQTNTATHRTSSSGIPTLFKRFPDIKRVQFQNLPNEFKSLFTVRKKGRVVCEVDGSQLEFRVAGQLSRDAQMVADILDPDFDVHVLSASAMTDKPYEELLAAYRSGDKEAARLRKYAKRDTFGPLYGKQFGTEEQLRWIKRFRERWHGFYSWASKNTAEVLDTKRLITPYGMRYYWPFASMSKHGYCNVSTQIYNYPVQGFATAEIIPLALINLARRIKGKEDRVLLVNTVHDSVICEVSKGELDWFKQEAIAAFTTDVYKALQAQYNYSFDLVPLGVGLSWGSHWNDDANEEEEYNVFADGRIQKR